MTDEVGSTGGGRTGVPDPALRFRGFRGIALVVALLLVTACGATDTAGKKTLVVHAAASLRASFTELVAVFEAEHEDVDVKLSLGGSADLVTQILEGAPADVFASADTATMDRLGDRAVEPVDFATNTLQIVVPPGNPAGIETLDDLADPDLDLVVCASEVPCGRATESLAAASGLELEPDSREQSVTDVLGKVAAGEAEAGVVYVTDVAAAGGAVEGITVPEAADVVNTYPITVVEGTRHEELARAFVELVRSETGRRVLRDAGFGVP